MNEVWSDLVISQYIVEQLAIMWNEKYMIRAIVVPEKHGIEALMLDLKELEM